MIQVREPEKILMPKIIGILTALFCFSTSVIADDLLKSPPIIGTYKVVTMRNASNVARAIDPLANKNEAIGQEITFTDEGALVMKGIACDHWEVFASFAPVIDTRDPMLSDIHVPPTDSPKSSGDQRISKTYHYKCEGESFIHVYQVDNRVLVIPWENSSRYLIAEIPLSEKQIKTLQAQLKDMKFHHFDPTGILDKETLLALSSWAGYRLQRAEAYRFKRTAITENLLDALGVLDQ
jgi:hypothetical protein